MCVYKDTLHIYTLSGEIVSLTMLMHALINLILLRSGLLCISYT